MTNYSLMCKSTENSPEMFVAGPLEHKGITPLWTGLVHMHVPTSFKILWYTATKCSYLLQSVTPHYHPQSLIEV